MADVSARVLSEHDFPLQTITAIGWFHGVSNSFEPITSGCRYCLVYDIRVMDGIPRPTITSLQPALCELKDALTAWSIGGPRAIFYLLENSTTDVAFTKLQGRDKQIAHALDVLTKEPGSDLRLGLVKIKKIPRDKKNGRTIRQGEAMLYDDFIIALSYMVNIHGEILSTQSQNFQLKDGDKCGLIPENLLDCVREDGRSRP